MSTIKVNRIENTATTDGGINIDSNGKIGVGTASPTETLTLNTSSGASIGFEHNGTEIATINNNAAALYVHAGSGKLLSLGANGSEAMRIDSSGNVGVGVSSLSSSSRLTLLESAGNGQTLEIKGANTGGVGSQPGIKFTASTGDNIGGIYGDTNSDSVILQSGGTERMRIDSSGNLTAYSGSTDGNYFVIRGKHSPGNDYNRSEVRFGVETNANGLGFLAFATGNNTASERLRIDSSGRVGIGTTSPSHGLLTLSQSASSAFNALVIQQGNTGSAATDGLHIGIDSAVDAYIMHKESRALAFGTANTERLRIDSSGRVLIGSSAVQAHPNMDDLQLGDGSGNRGLTISSGTSGYGTLAFGDSADSSGTDRYSGSIEYYHADNSMRFYANIGERMRIKNNGAVLVGQTTDSFGNKGHILNVDGRAFHTVEGNAPLWINRQTNDGDLLKFYAQDVQEGAIVVSGTSVTLSGAHLSRWSQLPGGAARSEILRGSVLSNLDEMCEWGTEDNEQLNRMKVSDVEGDKNVSGVFQSWDDDDDTYVNDFYCAMTGDFVIRIAQGTTVARGDLLMSAGDGTAKPQDDDIVRSKTIAKVTSTTVSTTYSDNSYCVPCVLMAC